MNQKGKSQGIISQDSMKQGVGEQGTMKQGVGEQGTMSQGDLSKMNHGSVLTCLGGVPATHGYLLFGRIFTPISSTRSTSKNGE